MSVSEKINVSDRTKGSIVIAKLGICVKTGSLETAKRALLELPDTVLKAGQTRSVNHFLSFTLHSLSLRLSNLSVRLKTGPKDGLMYTQL